MALSATLSVVSGRPASAEHGAELLVTMQVDRMVVEPGGSLIYWVRVDNIGDDEAAHVRVTAHLPRHTTATTEHCGDGTIEPDGDVCVHPDGPTPGAGDTTHQVVSSRSPLPAGDGFTLAFSVGVDGDAPMGERLENHAHAATPFGEEHSTAPVETLVVGYVPRAVAGAEAVTLTGDFVTDGYKSSVGPYEVTHAPIGGDLASNADIRLAGTVLVNGDARPGPDHMVAVSGNAVVTGSTAPSFSAFALAPVNAAAYADRNANRLLCASPQACLDASFSTATRVLTVSGRAVVGPGAYYLCGLDVKGRLEVRGPATFWIGSPDACPGGGQVRVASGGLVVPDSGRPRDVHLRLQGSLTVGSALDLRSQASFTGVVYAPASDLVIGGGAQLFGGATTGGEMISGTGGGFLHRDRSLDGG